MVVGIVMKAPLSRERFGLRTADTNVDRSEAGLHTRLIYLFKGSELTATHLGQLAAFSAAGASAVP
jgi:hypothetical protein